MTSRNHPIRQMLDESARGRKPTKQELKELGEALAAEGVPAKWISSKVAEAAERIVQKRADGYMGQARRKAAAATEEIVSRLPEYEEPTERDLPEGPRELADIVRGEGPDAQSIRKEVENISRY